MANGEQRPYTERSIQGNRGQSQEIRSDNRQEELITSLIGLTAILWRPPSGGAWLPSGSPAAGRTSNSPAWTPQPAGCTRAQAGWATAMGAILPPLSTCTRESNGSWPAPRSRSACSEFDIRPWLKVQAFPDVERPHGPGEAMHHEAIGRIADQILSMADGIDGGPARGGKNAAFELHRISIADLTVVGTAGEGNRCKGALLQGAKPSRVVGVRVAGTTLKGRRCRDVSVDAFAMVAIALQPALGLLGAVLPGATHRPVLIHQTKQVGADAPE